MRRGRRAIAIAILIGSACAGDLTPAAAQGPPVALTFDETTVGEPGSRRPAELFRPRSSAPAPFSPSN